MLFRFMLLMLPLLVPAISTLGAEALPLEYFTRPDDVAAVKISPDGRSIAASLHDAKGSHIAFLLRANLRDGTAVQAGAGAAIGEFEWISPDRLAYTLRDLEPERARQRPIVEIYTIAFADERALVNSYRFTKEARAVTADLVSDVPDDDIRVLIRERAWTPFGSGYRLDEDSQPSLSMLDTRSDTKTLVEQLPLRNAYVLLDARQHPRFAIGYDAQGRHAATWKPDSDWMPFSLPGFRAESLVPRHYAPAAGSVVFTGTEEKESRTALYSYALDSHEVTTLYAHPEFDVTGVVYALDGSTVIGARLEADKPEYHWLHAEHPTAKLYQMLERAFPGQSVEITSATADQRLVTALVHSDVDPGAYYVVDSASRKADLLFARRSWVDPAKMRPMEIVRLPARDGTVLHGYLTRPSDAAGPYPLIVLPHDEPYATRDVWGYDWRVQLFANAGYAVLQVNYRGSAGYGTDFREAGYREWGGKMQDDLTDATRWAIAQGIAAEDEVGLYGVGYGGYAALMGATREPALYRCAASYAGITDLEVLFARDLQSRSVADRTVLEQSFGPDRSALRASSPDYTAERIEAPVLLLHPELDPVTSYAHARYMNDALLGHGKRVRLDSLAHGDHDLQVKENRDEVYAKLLDFFASFLAQRPADTKRPKQ